MSISKFSFFLISLSPHLFFNFFFKKPNMSATDRLNTIKGHLSGNFPKGMLAGEVAIITGSG